MKPFEFIAGSAKAGILLICDHASNRIPNELGSLGIEAEVLGLHVAWDIGAAGVTRGLAARLGVPAVLTPPPGWSSTATGRPAMPARSRR